MATSPYSEHPHRVTTFCLITIGLVFPLGAMGMIYYFTVQTPAATINASAKVSRWLDVLIVKVSNATGIPFNHHMDVVGQVFLLGHYRFPIRKLAHTAEFAILALAVFVVTYVWAAAFYRSHLRKRQTNYEVAALVSGNLHPEGLLHSAANAPDGKSVTNSAGKHHRVGSAHRHTVSAAGGSYFLRVFLPTIAATLLICPAYSMYDQWHKTNVPGRHWDTNDLLYDFVGYTGTTTCMVILFALGHGIASWRHQRRIATA